MKPTKSRPHVVFLTLSDQEMRRVKQMARAQANKTDSSRREFQNWTPVALVRAALYLGFYNWAAFEDIDLDKEREEEIRHPFSFGHFRHRHGSAKLTEVLPE